MALYSSLASLSQTAGSNAADGAVDAPSTIDQQTNLLASFIAQLRDGTHEYAASIAGTNAITGTIASNPIAYVVGRGYRFVAAAANTGAVTLNFNSIGAKSLLKVGNVALTGGELQGTAVYEAVWDGVNFQLVGMYGFKSSLTASGYQKLPSGVILQWGSLNTSASATTAVSFPVAYTATAQVSTTAVNSTAVFATNFGGSTTGFNTDCWLTSGSRTASTVSWIAIGY